MAFEKLREGLQGAINNLKKAVVVDKKVVRDYLKQVQKALLSADVNVKLVVDLSKKVEDRALLEKPPGMLSRKENLIKITYDELTSLLGNGGELVMQDGMTMMLVGVQGSGKTTTAAKLAAFYKKKGLNVRLICADTFRPAAYTQLQQLAKEISVPFYGETEEKDTLKIIQNGFKHFKSKGFTIIDSEGRHKLDTGLMEQINMISKEVSPDRTLLVLDGTIGQTAGEQAQAFNDSCSINGIIISKLDGSAKGGGSISACATTNSPVNFIGVGEHIADLEVFEPVRFVGRLLGMGDIEGLLEKAKEVDFDEAAAKRMLSGKFNLEDVYQQIQQMQSMGSMDKLMEMMPFGAKIPKDLVAMQQDKIEKFKFVMDSMTTQEKEDPSIVKRERIERIAQGAGTDSSDVRDLLNYYKRMKKMMKGAGGGKKLNRMIKQFGMG